MDEKLETQLIDYIDGKLSEAEMKAVEQELMNNKEAFKVYEQLKEVIQVMNKTASLEPSSKLRQNFDQMLKSEIISNKKHKTILFQPAIYRVAAAVALLIIGGGIGFWISK